MKVGKVFTREAVKVGKVFTREAVKVGKVFTREAVKVGKEAVKVGREAVKGRGLPVGAMKVGEVEAGDGTVADSEAGDGANDAMMHWEWRTWETLRVDCSHVGHKMGPRRLSTICESLHQ